MVSLAFFFFLEPLTQGLEAGTTHSDLGPLSSIINAENALQTWLSQPYGSIYQFFSSQMTLAMLSWQKSKPAHM